MEMQWKSIPYSFLRCAVREVQNQEQTLELRLTEGMPDVGRVLCAWGQPQLREKQWRTEEFSVSGGISAWVLYIPEDGSQPRCAEGWIPLQVKWKLPPNTDEGFIHADVKLRSIDARAISSRKIMVRASISILGEALQPQQLGIAQPDELPDEICLLRQSYPVELIKEAGEKLFSVEETVQFGTEQPVKLLCCRMNCQIIEQSVAGGRLVFRGFVQVEYIYLAEDDRLRSEMQQIPFAQFTDLEQEFDKDATALLRIVFADAHWFAEGNSLQIKCDLIGQYMVYDRCLLQITEDVYSPQRKVVPDISLLEIPVRLDQVRDSVNVEVEIPVEAQNVVDVTFLADHPVHYWEHETATVELPGVFQTLYYDAEGNLQSYTANCAGHWQFGAGENCYFAVSVEHQTQPSAMPLAEQLRLHTDLAVTVQTLTQQKFTMVSGMEMGEVTTQDPNRPSLILRKANGQSLWELAKKCGSTVEAIEKANGITGQPDPENILLIPVV